MVCLMGLRDDPQRMAGRAQAGLAALAARTFLAEALERS